MIDFHSHVLPYMDDGSKNFDMSLDMLRISTDEEVKHICATPHFIVGEYEIYRENYDEKLKGLRELCKTYNVNLDIMTGLEIYINPDIPKLYEEGKVWGINDTKYLLIELPMEQFPRYTEDVFYELRLKGAVPIIAHPERNLRIMKDPSLLTNLLEQGVLAQLNAGSLNGLYGKEVKKFAEDLVSRNMIHMLGSDGHNISGRNTKISGAFNMVREINSELYDWISRAQYDILRGSEVEVLPVTSGKKKFKLFNLFK